MKNSMTNLIIIEVVLRESTPILRTLSDVNTFIFKVQQKLKKVMSLQPKLVDATHHNTVFFLNVRIDRAICLYLPSLKT